MTAFDQTQYIETTFKDLAAPAEAVEGVSFQDCTFENCRLSESAFRNCRFETCTFKGCDLSLAKLPHTRFKNVSFKGCRLVGVNWCDAAWSRSSLLKTGRVRFDSCLLDHALFIGLDLTGTSFKDCQLRGADFESANLTRADFRGADLAGARFAGCDLSEATFVGAQGYQINAAYNTLHQTRFSLPEAVALLHSLDIILEDDSLGDENETHS